MAETITDHEALIQGLVEDVINAHEPAEIHAFVTEDMTVRGASHHDGADEFEQYIDAVIGAFPDVAFELRRTVVQGDSAAFRVTVTGTHEGAFEDIPPTGNEVSYTASMFCSFRDGKISEIVYDADRVTMLEQLGVMG